MSFVNVGTKKNTLLLQLLLLLLLRPSHGLNHGWPWNPDFAAFFMAFMAFLRGVVLVADLDRLLIDRGNLVSFPFAVSAVTEEPEYLRRQVVRPSVSVLAANLVRRLVRQVSV